MADPLTLTTSILAILGACSTASKTLARFRKLKDARLVVQTLNNEISDLCLILERAKEHFEVVENRSSATSSMDKSFLKYYYFTLDQTRSKILQAESLIQYQLIKAGRETELQIDKSAYWREHGKLGQLKCDIRKSKQSIIGLFSQLGVSESSKLQVNLEEVRMRDLPKILQSTNRIESTLSEVLSLQSPKEDKEPGRPHNPLTGGLIRPELSSIEISVARLTSHTPATRCSCRRQRTSFYVQTFLGSLFMCYTAYLEAHRDRLAYKTRSIVVQYVFPTWFLRYMICFGTKWSPGRTMSSSLTIAQVIPSSHIVYDLITLEDIEGLRNLLVSDQIYIEAQSPSPVSGSLLWV